MNNFDYKYMTPFKWFVLENFPFIENDFEAINNYRLFSKVVEYLNKTIDNVNVLGNLVEQFSEYFDNLDVQEEINNKLDEMVEQGTLQEIIADYLNSKAIFGFDTVNDMKQATNLIDGSYAKTLGYYSKNDGGMATYKIRTITNEDVVDNMLIIQMDDENLIAEYVNENNIIRPEQMGAYGDNIHNDYNILNALLSIANNNNYKIVGNKTYKINTTLNITYDNLNITLNVLNYTGVENAIYLKGKDNTINIKKIISSGVGLFITCDDNTTTTRNHITIDLINSQKHGIYFYTISWGIYENYINFTHFIISDITNYGIYLYSEKTTNKISYINQTVINGGRVDGGLYALYANATSTGQINELLTYNMSGEGCQNGIYLNNVTDSSFENWRLEELTLVEGKKYMKLEGNSGNNNFRFNRYVPLELIDRTSLSNTNATPNIIYSNIRDTRVGGYIGSIMKFFGTSQLEIVSPKLRSKSITGDTTLTQYEFVKFFNVQASATQPTITLNDMYGDDGINEFYVYKRSGTTKVIIDYGESPLGITRDGLNHVLIIGNALMVQ